jgi:hypothetical protein
MNSRNLEDRTEEKPKLTDKERRTIERLGYTLMAGVALTTIGGVLAVAGLKEYGAIAGLTGGLMVTTYAGFMYPPFVPVRTNRFRELKRRYLEEIENE